MKAALAHREPIYRESTYQDDKRCMLAAAKPGADFSVGCAGKRIVHLLFATHPHPAVREWVYASARCCGVLAVLSADAVLTGQLYHRTQPDRKENGSV